MDKSNYNSVGHSVSDITKAVSRPIVERLKLSGRLALWAMLICDRLVTAIMNVREQESIRTRLSALMALCVENQFGSPLRVNNRLVLATAHQPSSKPEFHKVPVLVECLGGSFRFSEADALAMGLILEIPEHDPEPMSDRQSYFQGYPRLMSKREEVELKLLLHVTEWAESQGILERGWSSDPDLHIELGLRAGPSRKAKDDRRLEDLVQYRVDRTTDEKRILWIHKLETQRTERTVPTPIYSTKVVEREFVGATLKGAKRTFGVLKPERVRHYVDTAVLVKNQGKLDEVRSLSGDFVGFEQRATGRDEQDTDREVGIRELHDHEGYCGVKPRRNPTRDENALLTRDRYRIDDSAIWLCQFTDGYERLQKQLTSLKGKPFKTDWMLRSEFTPRGSDKAIKFWEKRFFPADLIALERVASEGGVTFAERISDNKEVARIMSDPDKRGDYKLTWKRGGFDPFSERMLPHPDVAQLGNELFAMLRGAIEERAFSHIALVPTADHSRRLVKSQCFGCIRKWGKEGSAVRNWNRMAHAWVCPVCGSERARVHGRVWVSVDLLGMLPIKERLQKVTHVEFAVYGPWLGELINKGLKVDGKPRAPAGSVSRPKPKLAHVQS